MLEEIYYRILEVIMLGIMLALFGLYVIYLCIEATILFVANNFAQLQIILPAVQMCLA